MALLKRTKKAEEVAKEEVKAEEKVEVTADKTTEEAAETKEKKTRKATKKKKEETKETEPEEKEVKAKEKEPKKDDGTNKASTTAETAEDASVDANTEESASPAKSSKAGKGGRVRSGEPLLQQLNRRYQKTSASVSPSKKRKLTSLERIEKFREVAGNETVVTEFYTDFADGETGDLASTDDWGVNFIITADDVRKLFPKYIPYTSGYLLGSTFKVTIKSVDESGNVFLNPVKCTLSEGEFNTLIQKTGKYDQKHALAITLLEGIKAPKKPLVRGTVVRVERERIFVDIFDTGVIAVVTRKHFMKKLHSNLQLCVEVGDSLKGVIFAHRQYKDDPEPYFVMNTARYYEDHSFDKAKHFKPGDTIVIRCVEIPENLKTTQQYFWGLSPLVPGIDIMSDLSPKIPAASIELGSYYKCKVKKIDVKKMQLKVVPFARTSPRKKNMEINW